MARRRLSISASPSPETRPVKRQRIGHLTKEDFKGQTFLAPMVRSGTLLTRLYALRYGASLVWGPEMVDKAMLHANRIVDPKTGVISYNGKSRAMFTTHPVEKPYLIFQIGSADPALAVAAARSVMSDVSGIDLNCGCPKPFSTHAGMGAALLTNPDLLCSILTALREALPPEITVTAKIRLLPTQEETMKLVERIINCGVSAITIHCRTRNMRPREKALIERLTEIVGFVESLGKGIAVIENGDCQGIEDAKRIRELTGAHSVMIATAAEANPSVFSVDPLQDIEHTLVPDFIRLGKYLDNHWSLTKHCANQFKSARSLTLSKSEATSFHQFLSKSKGYDDAASLVDNRWTGEAIFADIKSVIEARPPRNHEINFSIPKTYTTDSADESEAKIRTPEDRPNPEPPSLNAPLLPFSESRQQIPSLVSGREEGTPTPGGGLIIF